MRSLKEGGYIELLLCNLEVGVGYCFLLSVWWKLHSTDWYLKTSTVFDQFYKTTYPFPFIPAPLYTSQEYLWYNTRMWFERPDASHVLNCGSVLAPPFTSDSPSKLFSLITLCNNNNSSEWWWWVSNEKLYFRVSWWGLVIYRCCAIRLFLILTPGSCINFLLPRYILCLLSDT